ncbi:aspartyl/asparaginyl beta-hydroxylase-like dioxygenase [Pseudomonas sp. GM102]|uniref:aspartyl/asparaginyl beta-hydroxylase domain-containing protein n=1 Tax=Pseudomonas sp. GM102 TaxID=1144321 RepID=UPI00026F4C6A|nr:aspartyl/asparaginyl beta-hydroxylase domain-containing protein [Pseudomonas sp. GM102]EJL95499.1 aspartyl/asparaginyl beta-hydroxylase-like dioxygenase [Pseudomonas sp. GM102]
MRPSFYPLDSFKPLLELKNNWQIIRDELSRLQAPLLDIDRTDKSHAQVFTELNQHMLQGGDYGWLKGWGQAGGNRDWVQFALQVQNQPIEAARAFFPETLKLLDALDGLKVCSLARLAAHSFLSCHRHPEVFTEGLLQMHITLSAADERNYAYLNVNGEFHQHRMGEAVIFDGSLDHFVVNASEVERTILYLEFDKARMASR